MFWKGRDADLLLAGDALERSNDESSMKKVKAQLEK
jgi:hypothetical protein